MRGDLDEKNHFKQYMSVRNSITLLVQQYVGIRSTEKRKNTSCDGRKIKIIEEEKLKKISKIG